MVDAGSSPLRTGISHLQESTASQGGGALPLSQPGLPTYQPSGILIQDSNADRDSENGEDGIDKNSTLYKPQTKTNQSSRENLNFLGRTRGGDQNSHLEQDKTGQISPTKTTVFMTHASKDSEAQMQPTYPNYHLSTERKSPSEAMNSRSAQESRGNFSSIHKTEKQSPGQLLNMLTRPKATHNQTRKPLDKLLTEEMMGQFTKILGQVKEESGKGSPYKLRDLEKR